MSDQIRYEFAGIETGASDIDGTVTKINGLLDDLKTDLKPMVDTWEGSSATAYTEAQQKWDTAAADLNSVLSTIATAVRNGSERMSDLNNKAAQSWS
ncbi:WXG100 family type VII secretion target [Corynebacterium ulceribovis]|uniref:WXG100 family type VII secretion target n=1 Tax=Corynebacterium ulceribovis TaxID=487732 RepID=UPI00037FE82F|nr:WXG100 family type VII secretion target [Corynebacterium ulceribovis]